MRKLNKLQLLNIASYNLNTLYRVEEKKTTENRGTFVTGHFPLSALRKNKKLNKVSSYPGYYPVRHISHVASNS